MKNRSSSLNAAATPELISQVLEPPAHTAPLEVCNALSSLQTRLYRAKSNLRGAEALAEKIQDKEFPYGLDLYTILIHVTDELEAIGDAMGNFLPP